MAFMIDEKVLWLNVPIHNVERMHVGKCKNDLHYEEQGHVVNEVFLGP